MAIKDFPTISIIIPTYNEKDIIHICLFSIFKQDYPKEKMEVIVIDNDSTDGTLQIVKQFPVRILFNKVSKNSIVSKRIGFENSKGTFYIWVDADMEIPSPKWMKNMIKPLMENPEIVASVTCFKIKGDEAPLTKFLTMDYNQRDPIYQLFSPSIYETIVEKKDGYYLCEFSKNKIPSETGAEIIPLTQEEYDPYDQMYKLLELGNIKEENFEIIPNKQKRTFKVILNAPTDKSKSEFYQWLVTNNFNNIPKEKFLFEESPKK